MDKYKPAYRTISSVGISLLRRSRGSATQNISQLLQRIDESWSKLQDDSTRRMDDLRIALEVWERYTEQMEDLMGWLRHTEKVVRHPLGGFTRRELEEQLSNCRVCINQCFNLLFTLHVNMKIWFSFVISFSSLVFIMKCAFINSH